MFTNNQLDISSLPKAELIDFTAIDKRYFYVILINISIIHALLVVLFVIFWKIYGEAIGNSMSLWLGLGIIITFFIAKLIVSRIAFKYRKYALRDKDITYREGLLMHKQTTLPFNRIQHVELQRSFMSKQFGLSTLRIYSAGESGSDLSIKGLPKDEASKINDFLITLLSERNAI